MSALILGFYSALLKLSSVRLDVSGDMATHRMHRLHSELTDKVNTV